MYIEGSPRREKIAVLDSGVGGLTVLRELKKQMPDKDLIYLGDNGNVPYGNKTDSELFSLFTKNLSILSEYRPSAVVLACNTLTVEYLYSFRNSFSFGLFGIYPPIEYAICRYRAPLLLATPKTITYYKGLFKGVDCFALPDLAENIEENIQNTDKITLFDHLKDLPPKKYDSVILGCTHYPIIYRKFQEYFPDSAILDGAYFTAKRVKTYLSDNKSPVFRKNYVTGTKGEIDFIGFYDRKNASFYKKVVSSENFMKKI